jgi:hypothetical protein
VPGYALPAVVGGYGLLALLLLGLAIGSLWRWPVKAAAILVTAAAFAGSYVAVRAMLGWPTEDRLPERASFLASRIVEPDRLADEPGTIFVWLQAIDAANLPVGAPRAYALPYRAEVAEAVVQAQRLRFQGRDVVGLFRYDAAPEPAEAPAAPALPGQEPTELAERQEARGGAGGFGGLNQDLQATFQEMPALPLPDKLPILDDSY